MAQNDAARPAGRDWRQGPGLDKSREAKASSFSHSRSSPWPPGLPAGINSAGSDPHRR